MLLERQKQKQRAQVLENFETFADRAFSWEEPESYDQDNKAKSFYFFDIDENILNLSSSIYLKHKTTQQFLKISGKNFVSEQNNVGKQGPFKDYRIDFSHKRGSFKEYRDQKIPWWKKLFIEQNFIKDIKKNIKQPDHYWQGPSWPYFCHAILNKRSVVLITARGHSVSVLKKGFSLLVKHKYLAYEPNYLGVYAVNSNRFLKKYATKKDQSTAELKNIAIERAVKKALTRYGSNHAHRFGMSDDDPKNLEQISKAMNKLKKLYPKNSFFVFDTKNNSIHRTEI